MSMLAERKIKQKWSLNPRGKDWSEDSNKFGEKMLEKMGWSKGKGLGAKENGITEHIKISYKNDSKGMGYKETNDQWTEHDDKFNAFLRSIAGEGAAEAPPAAITASLEAKSQRSRARLHYRKYTRGKDLSRCSAKDLANIFGRRTMAAAKPAAEEAAGAGEGETGAESEYLVAGGSMLDYFRAKMPKLAGGGYQVGSNGVLKAAGGGAGEGAVGGFGFGYKSETIDNRSDFGGEKIKTKKQKLEKVGEVLESVLRAKKKKCKVENVDLPIVEQEDGLHGDENGKKSKKKRKDSKKVGYESEVGNGNGVEGCQPLKKKKMLLEVADCGNSTEIQVDVNESVEIVAKKVKKPKKSKKSKRICEESEVRSEQVVAPVGEKKHKKKKKKVE